MLKIGENKIKKCLKGRNMWSQIQSNVAEVQIRKGGFC